MSNFIEPNLSTFSQHNLDLYFMNLAIQQSKLSEPIDSAYCVGALLVDLNNNIISTGYSRELPNNTHAEEVCYMKLLEKEKDKILDLSNIILYTTMEPCSIRLSGKKPCVNYTIEYNIKRVVIGAIEPSNFVICKGLDLLKENNIQVIIVDELTEKCLEANTHLLK